MHDAGVHTPPLADAQLSTPLGIMRTRVDRWVGTFIDAMAAALLVVNLAIVFVSVIFRYALHAPFEWADDVPRVLLVALTFFGSASALRRGQHAGIEVLRKKVSPAAREVLAAFSVLVTSIVAGCLVWFGISLGGDVAEQTTASGISQAWFIYPMALGGAAMLLFAVNKLIAFTLRPVVCAIALLAAMAACWLLYQKLTPSIGSNSELVMMLAAFLVCLAAGVPIAFSLGFSALTLLAVDGNITGAIFAQQASSGVDNFVLLAVPFFILTGYVMEVNGMSIRLIELIQRGVGHIRGGLNVVMVLSMIVFSGISGSKLADVAAVGSVLIPAARRSKQDPNDAVALLAASAVMAETIPPCINLIILGYVANISITGLFIAGIAPALLLAASLIAMSVIFAPKRAVAVESLMPGTNTRRLLVSALICGGMVVIIFGGFRSGFATATEISAFAAVYAGAVGGIVFRELTWKKTWSMLVHSASLAGMVLFIIALAQTVAFLLTLYQVPHAIADALIMLSKPFGAWSFLLMSIMILIVMGAVLEGAAAIIIFGPLLVPVAMQVGINPLHFGTILIMSMGVGMFLPPLGLGLYACCAIGNVPIEATVKSIIKYFSVLLVCIFVLAFFPEITMALPRHFGFMQ
jgi:tripartite ATP-independent transporter DctM subunit